VRSADDYGVAGDDRSRVESDLTAQEIDVLIVVHFQIDCAVFSKAANSRAGLGVKRDKAVARSDVEDSIVRASRTTAPVRQSAAGELARRIGSAHAFAFRVRP
jgi:hypothetical protein